MSRPRNGSCQWSWGSRHLEGLPLGVESRGLWRLCSISSAGFTTTCRLGVGRTLFRVPGCLKRGRRWPHETPVPVAPRAGPPRRRQLSRPGFTVPACPACKPVPGLDPAYIMDPEAASKKESFGCTLPSDGLYPIAAPGIRINHAYDPMQDGFSLYPKLVSPDDALSPAFSHFSRSSSTASTESQ